MVAAVPPCWLAMVGSTHRAGILAPALTTGLSTRQEELQDRSKDSCLPCRADNNSGRKVAIAAVIELPKTPATVGLSKRREELDDLSHDDLPRADCLSGRKGAAVIGLSTRMELEECSQGVGSPCLAGNSARRFATGCSWCKSSGTTKEPSRNMHLELLLLVGPEPAPLEAARCCCCCCCGGAGDCLHTFLAHPPAVESGMVATPCRQGARLGAMVECRDKGRGASATAGTPSRAESGPVNSVHGWRRRDDSCRWGATPVCTKAPQEFCLGCANAGGPEQTPASPLPIPAVDITAELVRDARLPAQGGDRLPSALAGGNHALLVGGTQDPVSAKPSVAALPPPGQHMTWTVPSPEHWTAAKVATSGHERERRSLCSPPASGCGDWQAAARVGVGASATPSEAAKPSSDGCGVVACCGLLGSCCGVRLDNQDVGGGRFGTASSSAPPLRSRSRSLVRVNGCSFAGPALGPPPPASSSSSPGCHASL